MLGGLGFPLGQCLQSFHAWNPEVFKIGAWATLDAVMNWWNRIEWTLAAVHVTMLILGEFSNISWANGLYDPGVVIPLIPIVAVAGGRWWPFLLVLPGTLVPIAGKTIRTLAYDAHAIDPAVGWVLHGVLPVLLTTAAAVWFARHVEGLVSGREFARRSLLFSAWLYFGLTTPSSVSPGRGTRGPAARQTHSSSPCASWGSRWLAQRSGGAGTRTLSPRARNPHVRVRE